MVETPTKNPDEQDKFVAGIPMDPDEGDTSAADKAKAEEEAKVKADEEAKAKADADAKAQAEADKAKADADAAAKAQAEDDDKGREARPEKYIPLAKYIPEKKEWGEKEADYQKRIAELEAIASTVSEKKQDEAVKAYAEKYGVPEESVADLRKALGIEDKKVETPAKPDEPQAPKLSPDQQAAVDEANLIKAEKAFETEFTDVGVPELKKHFPNATPEQLEKAKKELEALATTRDYLDKPLDFIVYKEQSELAKLFPEPKAPRGVEANRVAPQKSTDMTADDFKDAKDFSALNDLSATERDKLVKEFSNDTWTRYKLWVKANDELVIDG